MRASSSVCTSIERLVFLGLMVLVGCAGAASAIPRPNEAHVRFAAERWPGTSQAELAEGRDLYVRKCGGCHALHRPADVVGGQWPANLDEMAVKAHLSAAQKTVIARYLEAVAGVEGVTPAAGGAI